MCNKKVFPCSGFVVDIFIVSLSVWYQYIPGVFGIIKQRHRSHDWIIQASLSQNMLTANSNTYYNLRKKYTCTYVICMFIGYYVYRVFVSEMHFQHYPASPLPCSLVLWSTGPTIHWSDDPLVLQPIGHSIHLSFVALVLLFGNICPTSRWSGGPLVLQLTVSMTHWYHDPLVR